MPEDSVRQSAPYLPFRTFLNALEALNHGVPPLIDRGIWRTQPGGVQGQIMGSLRFFGLIDDSNKPTQNLLRLIEKKEHRQAAIRALLEWGYADLVKGDITKMTAKMLEDGIEQYGVSGETRKKAVTFFLQAARYADMPLSPYLQSQIRATPSTRRRKRNPAEETQDFPADQSGPGTPVGGQTQRVELRSGGSISLTISINPFGLEKTDRDFVFELIDKLGEYDRDKAGKAPKP